MAQQILIKRGLLANLPATAPAGELLWTTDSSDLYVGTGIGTVRVTSNIESNYIPNAEKASANGVATLGADSKIPTNQLPALAITSTFTAVNEAAQLALVGVDEGDVVVRTDENKSYIHNGGVAGDMTDFQELLTPTDAVLSVNGATGAVTLTTTDIAEGTNLYFTDARADARIAAYHAGTTTDDLPEGVTNLYYTDVRAQAAADTQIAAADLADLNNVTDGSTVGQVLTSDGAGNWAPVDNTQSELEKVTEGGSTGWRLLGSDATAYLPLGDNSVTLSAVNAYDSGSETYGASGEFAFTSGYQTIATGFAATAVGNFSTANGTSSHAEGSSTLAQGSSSHAEGSSTNATGDDGSHSEGVSTLASGSSAHAEGSNTIASGQGSHAEGSGTVASGEHSHAQGSETRAINLNSHAAGQFNIGTDIDTIHETGIGADNSNRANAFEIYTDGRIHAPEQTIALHDDVRSLTTKEYVDAQVAGTVASIDDLSDVDTTTAAPTNGQVLAWDGSNWAPTDDIDTTVATLNDVGNVNITAIADGQIITWDNAASEWQNSALPTGVDGTFSGLTDTPANYVGAGGQVLKVNAGATGVEYANLTTTEIAEGTNLYYTEARATVNFGTNLALADTDDISEGATNLYFTAARADAQIALADIGDLANVTAGGTVGQVLTTDGAGNWVAESLDGGTF